MYEYYVTDFAMTLGKSKNLKRVTDMVNDEIQNHKTIFEDKVEEINHKIEE